MSWKLRMKLLSFFWAVIGRLVVWKYKVGKFQMVRNVAREAFPSILDISNTEILDTRLLIDRSRTGLRCIWYEIVFLYDLGHLHPLSIALAVLSPHNLCRKLQISKNNNRKSNKTMKFNALKIIYYRESTVISIKITEKIIFTVQYFKIKIANIKIIIFD